MLCAPVCSQLVGQAATQPATMAEARQDPIVSGGLEQRNRSLMAKLKRRKGRIKGFLAAQADFEAKAEGKYDEYIQDLK